jgi:hypothetical protein
MYIDLLRIVAEYAPNLWIDQQAIEDEILQNPSKYDWAMLSTNPCKLSMQFYQSVLIFLRWDMVLRGNFSQDFLRRHVKQFGPKQLQHILPVSSPEYANEAHWYNLSRGQMDEEAALGSDQELFYMEHISDINWIGMSKNKLVSIDFFERYVDKLNFSVLLRNNAIPIKFRLKHKQRMSRVLCPRSMTQDATRATQRLQHSARSAVRRFIFDLEKK